MISLKGIQRSVSKALGLRSDAGHQINRGERKALEELDRIFGGVLSGLRLAPEFFGLLGSPEFAGTPLAGSLALQNELQRETLAGLRGESTLAGKLPSDIASAVGGQIGNAVGALGLDTSPIAAVEAAFRLTGASEGIRQQRLQAAQSVLQQTGGGGIFPSASEFLNVGAQQAFGRANIRIGAAEARARREEQQAQIRGRIAGFLASQILPGGIGQGLSQVFNPQSQGQQGAGGGAGGIGSFLPGVFGGGGGPAAGAPSAGGGQFSGISQIFGTPSGLTTPGGIPVPQALIPSLLQSTFFLAALA